MIQLWSHPCCSSGTSDTDEAVLTWAVDNKDSGRFNMEAMFMLLFRFPHDLIPVTALLFTVIIQCSFYTMSLFMELLKESVGALCSYKIEVTFSHCSDPRAVNRVYFCLPSCPRMCAGVPMCF